LGQNKCQVKERMNEANEREKVIHPKAIWWDRKYKLREWF
jgi:hypothetical protein